MPTYEFECEKCSKTFTLIQTVAEFSKAKPRCPKCKTTKVRQLFSGVQTKTSKKS